MSGHLSVERTSFMTTVGLLNVGITTLLPGHARKQETTNIQRILRSLNRVLKSRHNEVSNMSQNAAVNSNSFPSGRPVIFRNATVLTIDPSLRIIESGDVLVVDNRVAEVGQQLTAPASAVEIDATGGNRMPGMVDKHRHMWQTALRGFGADWTLTNYFQFYYLNWGKIFRPEDIYAGNLLAAIEGIDAGVTTTVDWSHGLQTTEYADAAVDALEAVTGDVGINQMYDGGYMTPGTIYVHAASLSPDSYHKIAATGGFASVSTESECNAGQGYSPTWRLRKYGIPVSLSQDTSVWWSGDIFSAMRATLNADRAKEHDEAHEKDETVTNHILRAEDVVDYGTRGGAKALGLDSVIGSVEPGKKADLVLIKNDNSPVSFPILHPYGHVVYQAGRGDVHTVVVNGKVVKHEHKLVGVDLDKAKSAIESTIDYLKAEHGPEEWDKGMHPEIPEHETLNNPYTYRDDVSAWKESDAVWTEQEAE